MSPRFLAEKTCALVLFLSFCVDGALLAYDSLPIYLQQSAQYAPYSAAAAYRPPRGHCHVTQVNVLQRHGARYPTLGAAIEIDVTVDKLVKYHKKQLNRQYNSEQLRFDDQGSRWAFLNDWRYNLGIDDLLPYGEHEVVASAKEWAIKFTELVRMQVPEVMAISEAPGSKNTLHNYCPNSLSNIAPQRTWLELFASPIAKRLDDELPRIGLDAQDVINMAHLCAFETLAHQRMSPFCKLFTDDEWPQIEYHGDLGKYYGFAYGNDLSRAQGVGYVNELLSRLTGDLAYIKGDTTQVNQTLDRDPRTFPLDRRLYVDFSHDNSMLPIMTLLDLFHDARPLNPVKPDSHRHFVVSKIVSFAARMIVERVECKQDGSAPTTYVRILVNDAIQRLSGECANCDLCPLSDFVESMRSRLQEASNAYRHCFDV
ncbi:hypothetical protein ACM66B_002038 [Microbotryomycetes sp. NB124-2]